MFSASSKTSELNHHKCRVWDVTSDHTFHGYLRPKNFRCSVFALSCGLMTHFAGKASEEVKSICLLTHHNSKCIVQYNVAVARKRNE